MSKSNFGNFNDVSISIKLQSLVDVLTDEQKDEYSRRLFFNKEKMISVLKSKLTDSELNDLKDFLSESIQI
tara:strand:+ start:1231 stop:1443 length:213 start_codon:yes stop_codon:yes gene_type:complete